MTAEPIGPTRYADVNSVLHRLLSSAKSILEGSFVGMYLYGSLALCDFAPNSSDIDFVIVTADRLPEEQFRALQAMHTSIAAGASKWATELDGSYIPQDAVRRYDPEYTLHPHIDRGSGRLSIEPHDSDWVINRYVLREHGVVVAGPASRSLIDLVPAGALRCAVREVLHGWWVPMLDDPSRLQDPGYRCYAVLTMCRTLYTLRTGTVVSKPVAARWAQEELDERWHPLIEQAIAWPGDAPPISLNETLGLIRCTSEHAQPSRVPASPLSEGSLAL